MLEIRNAESDDLKNVALLMIENWQSTYKGLLGQRFLQSLDEKQTEKNWGLFISKEGHDIMVAYKDGLFAGFAAYQPELNIERCLYLDSLRFWRHGCDCRNAGMGDIGKLDAYRRKENLR